MLTALLFALAGLQSPAHACISGSRPVVTDSGIGAVRLGARINEIGLQCSIIKDTLVANWDYVEPERVVVVVLEADTVQAVVDSAGRVERVYIDNPRLKTADSLGVGTRLVTLAKRGSTGSQSEATFGVYVPAHCGLRFVITGIPAMNQAEELGHTAMRRFASRAKVRRIEITGC